MDKIKISEVAAELGYSSKEILAKAQEMGLSVKAANSTVKAAIAEAIYEYVQSGTILPVVLAEIEKPAKAVKKEVASKSTKSAEDTSKKSSTKASSSKSKVAKTADLGPLEKTAKAAAKDEKSTARKSQKSEDKGLKTEAAKKTEAKKSEARKTKADAAKTAKSEAKTAKDDAAEAKKPKTEAAEVTKTEKTDAKTAVKAEASAKVEVAKATASAKVEVAKATASAKADAAETSAKADVAEASAKATDSAKADVAEASAKADAAEAAKATDSAKADVAEASAKADAAEAAKATDSAKAEAETVKATDSAKVDASTKADSAKVDAAETSTKADSANTAATPTLEGNLTQPTQAENLAAAALQKRRGLVIVKRKKDEERLKASELKSHSSRNIASLSSMFSIEGSADKKKKKTEKKHVAAHKKEDAQKLDLQTSFAEVVLDDEQNVLILPDLTSIINRQKPEPEVIRQGFIRTTKPNPALPTSIARGKRKKSIRRSRESSSIEVKEVLIPKEIRLYELAEKLGKTASELISKLFMQGMMVTKNDFLDEETIQILGLEFDIDIEFADEREEFDYLASYEDESIMGADSRVPVVTIMGHVDHGKTSLLDFIRNSRVARAEAGGITQHVGAYMVEKNGQNITFIDTPGHEAFSAMRARGASVTDIAIIVVAADDGVKPQTKEAVKHAQDAGVPIIVAMNKIDKPEANTEMIKTQMSEIGIQPVEWGGANEFVGISAKQGTGIEELLELILLQAEVLELKANAKAAAKATVIEASMQKGRGVVTTLIVQNGTLRPGDTVVAGISHGRVRQILSSTGGAMSEVRPGECAQITGLGELPEAGEVLIATASDKEAREYAQKRYEYLRQKELSRSTKTSLDELGAKIKEGQLKSLPVILKSDVGGTLEAIRASLEGIISDEVRLNIISTGVGGITQNDIALASASENSVILGFNLRPTGEIKEKAKEAGVEIKTYNVIYKLLDDVKALLSGMLSPIISEEALGQAQIRQVINVPRINSQIAGCMVTEGMISRGAKIRLIREGVVIFEGEISSLKRFKDDAKEVAKGYECGVSIAGCTDMREGDFIESYKEVQEAAVL